MKINRTGRRFRYFTLVLWIIICVSCSQVPSIKDFDAEQWKADTKGCSGQRLQMLNTLMENKSSFIGISEAALYQYLGKPTRQLLDERNRKTYLYTISCDTLPEIQKLLIIDTDALNRVNIIRVGF